jgi:uncharacterized protein YndB with AHSA1/START domain
MVSDRIEKKVVLRAPRERVWKALTDASQFGTWFGVELDAPFVAGKTTKGRIVPTKVDVEVARLQEAHRDTPVDFQIERIEPMTVFAFRWHPFAIDRNVDYSREPTTLVQFELSDASGGTQLVITESGFDHIPLERRAKAFAANDGGWTKQAELIARYLG